MNGRVEHKLRNERAIVNLLEDMPECVSQYYYTRSSAKESKGCFEYISKIKMFLKFLDNNTKNLEISKITEDDVSRFMHSIEQTIDANGNVRETSFSYRKQIHSILNSFFEYLRKRKIILENPMDCIERPSSKDVVKRVYLGVEHLNCILEGIDNVDVGIRYKKWKTRDKAILTLFVMTGMRRAALTEINIEDLNFVLKTITVIDKRHKTQVYKMNNQLEMALKNWIEDRKNKMGDIQSDALFISEKRNRISETAVRDIVKKYSGAILGNDKEISPHKLRGAFCTILYNQTRDIEFVRRAVGHNHIETTQRYIIDDNMAKDEAASIMGDILG